jgi:hypothetical protein
MARGLSYEANYSWAHNISDGQGDAPPRFNVNSLWLADLLETGPYLTPADNVTNDQSNTNPIGDGSIVRPDRVGNSTLLITLLATISTSTHLLTLR